MIENGTPGQQVAIMGSNSVSFGVIERVTRTQYVLDNGQRFSRSKSLLVGQWGRFAQIPELFDAQHPSVLAQRQSMAARKYVFVGRQHYSNSQLDVAKERKFLARQLAELDRIEAITTEHRG